MLNNSAYTGYQALSDALTKPISSVVDDVKKTGVYKSPVEEYIQSTAPQNIKGFLQKWAVNNSVNSFIIYAVATFATIYSLKYLRSL